MNCRFCGKSFNCGFDLRRHECEYCSLQDHNSSTESDSNSRYEHKQYKEKICGHWCIDPIQKQIMTTKDSSAVSGGYPQ